MDRALSIGAAVIRSMIGADVVPRELGIAQRVLQHGPGGFPLVPAGFGWGEPGRDLLVDARVEGLPDGGGPQGEQVTGSPGPLLGVADLPGSRPVVSFALQDACEHGFGGGLLVRFVPGRGALAGDHVGGVGLAASGHADVQGLPGQCAR